MGENAFRARACARARAPRASATAHTSASDAGGSSSTALARLARYTTADTSADARLRRWRVVKLGRLLCDVRNGFRGSVAQTHCAAERGR